MALATAPRAARSARPRRRRSRLPCLLCTFVLAWAVIMVGFNIVRVLMLPEIGVRSIKREIVPGPPNYYELLGVTPLVDDNELDQLRKKHILESHPDKVDESTEQFENFITKTDMFTTLQNGRLRCEYDKKHRIKGKWPIQTCRNAFREEYRQLLRDEKERYQLLYEQQRASGKKGEPGSSKIKVEVKVEPPMPETEKPSSRKRGAWWGVKDEGSPPADAKPGARRAVPKITMEFEEDTSDKILPPQATRVWNDGIVPWLISIKITAAEVWSFIASIFSK